VENWIQFITFQCIQIYSSPGNYSPPQPSRFASYFLYEVTHRAKG
jgi:hypothetical protein